MLYSNVCIINWFAAFQWGVHKCHHDEITVQTILHKQQAGHHHHECGTQSRKSDGQNSNGSRIQYKLQESEYWYKIPQNKFIWCVCKCRPYFFLQTALSGSTWRVEQYLFVEMPTRRFEGVRKVIRTVCVTPTARVLEYIRVQQKHVVTSWKIYTARTRTR